MSPNRHWIALAAITLLLPLGASLAAPRPEPGSAGQGPREGGKGQKQGPESGERNHQKGDRKGGQRKPIFEEVIGFLKSQGVSDISSLSEDRRAELSQAFRDAKGKEHMTARIRAMVDALIAQGITTPAAISAMTDEQRMAIMQAVREKMEADGPPMGGPGGGPGGPGGGQHGGQGDGPRGGGGPEGPGGGGDKLLDHFANMLTEAGISDISNLSDSQIASLVPKPGDRKGDKGPGQGMKQGEGRGKGQGPGKGQGQGGQGKGPKGNREGKGPGQGRGPGGEQGGPGGQRGGPEGGGPRMDPVGMVLDFLDGQGIDSIADLTAEQIEELQMTWHETRRPKGD